LRRPAETGEIGAIAVAGHRHACHHIFEEKAIAFAGASATFS
jgi:hypothetical protein